MFYIVSPYFKIWSNSVVFAFMRFERVLDSIPTPWFIWRMRICKVSYSVLQMERILARSQFVFPLERFQLHHFRGQAGFHMQALQSVCTYIAKVTNEAWKSAVSILFCVSWMRHIQDMWENFWKNYWDEFDEIHEIDMSRSSQNLTSPIDRSKVDCNILLWLTMDR